MITQPQLPMPQLNTKYSLKFMIYTLGITLNEDFTKCGVN